MPTRYRAPGGDFTLVSLAQLAGELGRTVPQTKKLLDKLGFVGIKPRRGSPGRTIAYEIDDLEALKALTGQPHSTHSGQTDWLSDYLGGTPHGRRL
jgi:hypothetical protein